MLIEWFFAKKKKIDKGISIVLTVFFFFFVFSRTSTIAGFLSSVAPVG